MNGGYCMVDCVGIDATAEEATKIDGLYSKMYRCMGLNKPVILNNILSGDNGLYTPLACSCVLGDDIITVNAGVVKFTVSADDTVTITA